MRPRDHRRLRNFHVRDQAKLNSQELDEYSALMRQAQAELVNRINGIKCCTRPIDQAAAAYQVPRPRELVDPTFEIPIVTSLKALIAYHRQQLSFADKWPVTSSPDFTKRTISFLEILLQELEA